MSDRTYYRNRKDKPLVWLYGEVRTPPFSPVARVEAGFLLRKLQQGEELGMPHFRPMASVGARCGELRIKDIDHDWRIMVRTDADAVIVLAVFSKRTRPTPRRVLENCRRRLRQYDRAASGKAKKT